MRPSKILAAKSNGNTVSIIPIGDANYFYFGGASVPTNEIPGRFKSVHSLTLVVEKKGIVAVSVSYTIGKSNYNTDFFLSLENKDGKVKVDLDDQWFPKAERLGNISDYGVVNVMIDDKWYTTDEGYKLDPGKDQGSIKKGKIFVPDANLLCKYLIGNIDAQAVIDAAQEVTEEKSAREQIAELEKEKKKLTDLLDAAEFVAKTANQAVEKALKELASKEAEVAELNSKLAEFEEAVGWVIANHNNMFGKRTASLDDIMVALKRYDVTRALVDKTIVKSI